MRLLVATAAAVLALAGVAGARAQVSSPAPPIREGEHVRVAGTRLLLGTRAFHFVGANANVMHGRDERASLDEVLDAVAADGLSVVRIWALGEAPADAPAWRRDYAFRVGEQGWVESSFVHLDRVLAAARARNLRVVVVLANRWADYGGAPQYLRWAGILPRGRELGAGELARFLTCARCVAAYRAHVARVVERVSSITRVAYRDDPTILAWELANELEAGGSASEEALVRWVRDAAAFVRQRAPRQLIGAGLVGYGTSRERRSWLRVQRLPEIDYCDSHAYPTGGGSPVGDLPALRRWIDDRVQLAHHVVRKPLVWGELGFRTDRGGPHGRGAARWLDAFLERSRRDAAAGALVWIYERWRDRARNYGIYVDPEHAPRSREVRRVLARRAAEARERPPDEDNAALSDARGEAPLHRSRRTVRGPRRAPARWQRSAEGWRLSLDPLSFRAASFEAAGSYAEGAVEQLWGAGAGWVEYVLPALPRGARPARALVVRARASSELPGAGEGGAPEDTSRVELRLAGRPLVTWTAPVDDGLGAVLEARVEAAAGIPDLRRRAPGGHLLRLEASDAPGAGGLCLYRGATGREPLPPEVLAELPGRITVEWIEPARAPGEPRSAGPSGPAARGQSSSGRPMPASRSAPGSARRSSSGR